VRKTFNLDDDVAVLLEKVCEATNASLKDVLNAALRLGLVRMMRPFRTRVHSSGRCYLPNLDNTAEVLAIAEGHQFK
jgi:hypothetical protein